MWPRLQSSHEKPHWIGIDFDHWEYQKESEDEEEEEEEEGVGGAVDREKKARVVRLVDVSVCYSLMSTFYWSLLECIFYSLFSWGEFFQGAFVIFDSALWHN